MSEIIEKEIMKLVGNWIEMNGGLNDVVSNSPHYWSIIKDLVEDLSPYLGE